MHESIDILFLDIEMPGKSGIELRKMAVHVPACVFISGHAEYAAASFDVDTLDFIVKPVRHERFEIAARRIHDYLGMRGKAHQFDLHFGEDHLTIKEGHDHRRVKMSDLIYLEALKDYTLLATLHRKHCIYSNLGSLLKTDPFLDFVRIHKSYAVRRQYVNRVSANEIMLNDGTLLPVGRAFKENVNRLL